MFGKSRACATRLRGVRKTKTTAIDGIVSVEVLASRGSGAGSACAMALG
jgi:hypothetical protein